MTKADRTVRLVLGAAGIGLAAYGAHGLLDEPAYVDKIGVAKWLAGALLLHDAVFAVAVFATGAVVTRLAPTRSPWVRRVVLGGLAVGTAATLVALPALVKPWPPANPSVLPLDYVRGLALVWGVVAGGTALVLVAGAWTRRRR